MPNSARRRVRLTAALERTMIREVARAVAAIGEIVSQRVAAGSNWRAALETHSGALLVAVERGCKRAAVEGAQDVLAHSGKRRIERKAAPEPALVSQFVLSWVRRHSVKRVSQITKTTARMIRRQIITGTKRGWSPARIAKSIQDAMGGEIGKVRAARIARTETHTAFERGSYEQAREMQRLGLDLVAEWASTEDGRTRPDHAAASGQVVTLGQTFTVGGEAMRFPGDPRASAKQVVNCRCVALYYPKGTR